MFDVEDGGLSGLFGLVGFRRVSYLEGEECFVMEMEGDGHR